MSYLKALRHAHPKKIGDYYKGERITSTYYKRENGKDVAYFRTENRNEYRA